MGDITNFFKVKKLTDETKLAAQAQYAKLTNQVANITDNLDKDFNNNKISIKVAAPTLVIPFDQKSWQLIQTSESWVFTMGQVSFESQSEGDFNFNIHEAY